MSGFLSYFTNSTNKQPQEQSDKKVPNCPKSQINFQEIDCIDSSQEDKNEQKQQKIQQKPNSNQQKSVSSGDFQEMNENEDNNSKNQNKKQDIPSQMQDNCVQINMENTLQFRDQINQSISESHLLKRPIKNSLSKTNEMSFSDINQLNEKQESSKQQFKNQKQSQSIKIQYPNISTSRNSYKINQQMEESFEDFSTKNSLSKSKKSTVDPQTVANFLNLWQNKDNDKNLSKNQQNPTQIFNKPTFSFQKNQQKVFKQQQIKIQSSFNTKEEVDQQNEIFDVNRSLIAEKIKPISFKNNQKKTSPTKTGNLNQKEDQYISVEQSFYMAKVQQKPIKKPSTKIQIQKKTQNLKKTPFLIYLKDSLFFIKYGQTSDRRITDKIFQSLTQTFLMKNIMLPFFSLKVLEDYEGQIQIGAKKQKEELFSFYLNIYFEFLHKKYEKITKQFFEKEIEKNHTKSKMFDSDIGLKKDESSAILGVFYKKVIDYFKLSHYSKAQILKESLQSELILVSQFKQKWIQSQKLSPLEKQKQKIEKVQKMNVKVLDEKSLYLLKQIAGLQMLISFEKSEMYCEDKLKEKLQENIWKQRKKKLIQDRNWFISHLFSVCQI